MIEKVLNMRFKNLSGGTFSFAIKDVKEEILDTDISEAMDAILLSDVFISKGGKLATKESAEVVTKEITAVEL